MSADHSEARERARQEDCAITASGLLRLADAAQMCGVLRYAHAYRLVAEKLLELNAEGKLRDAEQERWISVEERLPTFEAWVDVVIDGCVQICPAQFDGELWYWYVEEADPAPKTSVSHWRKRPAPPVHKGDS